MNCLASLYKSLYSGNHLITRFKSNMFHHKFSRSVTGRAVSPLTDPIQPRVTQETMQQFNTTQVADAISLLPV